MVGPNGLEPSTSSVSRKRSNQTELRAYKHSHCNGTSTVPQRARRLQCRRLPVTIGKWAIPTRTYPARLIRSSTRERPCGEALTDLQFSQPAYIDADDVPSFHRDQAGGRPLYLGTHPLCPGWDERWARWSVGPNSQAANCAGAISRSDRGQAAAQHGFSGALKKTVLSSS